MKIRLSLLLIALPLFLMAQEHYMALTFGLGRPLGNFAKTESLATDGFAQNGFMADYSGAYYFVDFFAAGGNVKFNQSALWQDDLRDVLLDILPPEATDNITQFNTGFWSDVSLAIGPLVTLPIGIFSFDAYFYPGLHIVAHPRMYIEAEINGELAYTNLSSQNVRFGFESGINLRVKISSTAGLRFFGSYLQTSSSGEITTTDDSGNGSSQTVKFDRKIEYLNTGIGFIYYL
jgi:hypothetical protein